MTHNDLKEGDRVLLANGRRATIMDNVKGPMRQVWVGGQPISRTPVDQILEHIKVEGRMRAAREFFCSEVLVLHPGHKKSLDKKRRRGLI